MAPSGLAEPFAKRLLSGAIPKERRAVASTIRDHPLRNSGTGSFAFSPVPAVPPNSTLVSKADGVDGSRSRRRSAKMVAVTQPQDRSHS